MPEGQRIKDAAASGKPVNQVQLAQPIGLLPNLPVQAGEGTMKSQVGWRINNGDVACAVALKTGGELG